MPNQRFKLIPLGGAVPVVPPSNSVAPVISGTQSVGATLTATTGTWTGDAPITYSYNWKRNGVTLGAPDQNTYVLVSADYSALITCVVTATNAGGAASATSNTVSIIPRTNLLALWSLSDTSGTTAVNAEGTTARDGAYLNGVTLNAATFTDGTPTPSFDGTNDTVNVYSASINTALGAFDQFSFGIWIKFSAAGDLTDGVNHRALNFAVDASNTFRIGKTANNQMEVRYSAGGSGKNVLFTVNDTNWHYLMGTVDLAGNAFIVYLDGVKQGTTQTSIGTWVGALASTQCVLSATTTGGTVVPWKGNLKYAGIWGRALTAAEALSLGTVA